MSRKSPSLLKILNDTLDLMTLMTHTVCIIQNAVNTPSADGNEEVVSMFICEAQLQQLPPFLVVGFIVIIDFVYQCFHKPFQKFLAL